MSGHTRKHLTKSKAMLKKEIRSKIAKVMSKEDLIILNKVIDKYLPKDAESMTPAQAFGIEWTDKSKRLGNIIKGFRFRDGMNQSDLAKALKGVKQSNISAWENGKERIPEKRLAQLSKIFRTDLKKLVR